MQTKQAHLAFHLTGRQPAGTHALDAANLRPALLAGYRDLTELRYDFPLVLPDGEEELESVQSLSGVFDRALGQIARAEDGERLRKHAVRIERELRALAAETSAGALSELWDRAASRLSAPADELFRDSLDRLRAAVGADGQVVDCDGAMPLRLCKHVWKLLHEKKAHSFRANIDKLVMKLSDILRADVIRSKEGLGAERLAASVGTKHRELFDFAAMSRLLCEALPTASLPEARRNRIRGLISVLQSQRFFPPERDRGECAAVGAPYDFAFNDWTDAVEAHRERLPKMIELARAVAMAKLEVEGEYDAAKHDRLFEDFGPGDLDVGEFPSYLICVDAADMHADLDRILQALTAGFPAKVLVQTDDLVEPSPFGDELLGLGLRGKQLVSAAIGLGTFYVLQSSASHLFRLRDQIFRALACRGPALLSVFSGAIVNGLPPYLTAAMAMESRIFPAFTYDPSIGPDWASRFSLDGNPQPELDWPAHSLDCEDAAHQRVREPLAFTFADFAAVDPRYAAHVAGVPRSEWDNDMVPVSELAVGTQDDRSKVPYLLMVDGDNVLQRAIVDDRVVREMHRCAGMWRNLQELGGIHNSHAARLLAEERQKWADQSPREDEPETKRVDPAPDSPPAVPAVASEAERRQPSDDPWIETARCTSCNECIQLNGKMFGYDANKQASIVNPDAGTYRQLVEAAESCQVSIIHPGKPRNPDESGLDELRTRAELYL
jgi:ferredoxin